MAAATAVKPKLVVFDLDYTLWPFWVDTHVDPPFRKKNSKVVDARNQVVTHYKDTEDVLKTLHSEGYTLAVASRTDSPPAAQALLDTFGWNKYFTYKEMYPGSKLTHFKRFKEQSGIDYADMVFFDDEHRNITDTRRVGVFATLVDNGITWSLIRSTLDQYSQAKRSK